MKNNLIMLIVILIIGGCEKKNVTDLTINPDDKTTNPPALNIIWQSQLTIDNTSCRSMIPLLTNDGVVTSSFQSPDNEIIKKFDKESGDQQWYWSEFINPNPGQRVLGRDKTFIFENILTANSSQDNYGINLETGLTEWSSYNDFTQPYSTLSVDNLFNVLTYRLSPPYGDSASIIMCNPDKGNWREVYKFTKKDSFEVGIYPPTCFLNQLGDTLLIFQNRQIIINPHKNKVDLHCYNLTQKRMEWEQLEVDYWGNSNARAPLIDGDYCYFVGLASAYCFNIHTGEKIWQYDHDVAWQLSNFLIHEDNFIIKDDQSNLLAIDKNNGQLTWKNTDASACCVTMRLYGDRIYYGNSGLFIVDARTGEVLYRSLDSPNKEEFPGAEFSNTVAVDLEKGIMYATDGYFVMAMELPE